MRSIITRIYWHLLEYPFFPFVNFPFRIWRTYRAVWNPLRSWVMWLVTSREDTNLTYNLDALSKESMTATLAAIFGRDVSEVRALFREAENDIALREHVESCLASGRRRYVSDPVFRPSRRLAWYAVVRMLKPRIVIETGVDKGLGGVLLCAALLRNAEDGFPGQYVGTDKNPSAGELISGSYASVGRLIYGDSAESLRRFPDMVDLFINDSDHSMDYEALEYEIIAPKLTPTSVIIGDNSRWSDRLLAFSEKHGRPYYFIDEKSDLVWSTNEGMGISLPRKEL